LEQAEASAQTEMTLYLALLPQLPEAEVVAPLIARLAITVVLAVAVV
jgi:hypothetical protein